MTSLDLNSLRAFAEKRLPIRPGDYIFFKHKGKFTGSRLFVTSAGNQRTSPRGSSSNGQHVGGIAWDPKGGERVGEYWLDWSTMDDNWTIVQRV